MKIINDYYIIEFEDSIDEIKYLVNIGCKVYVHLEGFGYIFQLIMSDRDYGFNLRFIPNKAARGFRYTDNQILTMINNSRPLFVYESD